MDTWRRFLLVSQAMWTPLPERLELADGCVDAWILVVSHALPEACFADLLSADELARGRRFRFAKDRDLYWNARAALRILLGSYLGTAANALRFRYTSRGRPILGPEFQAGPMQFSVAHSDERVGIAFSNGPVGIDLELAGREVDVALMSKYLPDGPPDSRAFLRHWTRTEARLKAMGLGLGEESPTVTDSGWRFFDLPAEDYTIAVAAPEKCLHCRMHRLAWSGNQLTMQEPLFCSEDSQLK